VFRRAPERFSALRPPLDSGERSKVANSGRKKASRKRDGLFDMVKWNDGERFNDEPQSATRSRVLILRSARPPTARQSRMGVRASRRMRTAPISGLPEIGRLSAQVGYSRLGWWAPSCFETHRSAAASVDVCELAWAAMLLSMRASSDMWAKRSHVEAPTCGCGKRSRLGFPCFRPVIYNGWRNFNGWSGSRGPAAHRGCRMTPRAI
jgi:hypothetical protein